MTIFRFSKLPWAYTSSNCSFELMNSNQPGCHDKNRCSWRFEAHFLTCPFPWITSPKMDMQEILLQLSDEGSKNFHFKKVERLRKQRPKFQLSICVPALHNFSEWLKLVLFVEFYRYFGAKHFIVYNHSIDQNVDRVLRYYANSNVLEVVQWPSVYPSNWNLDATSYYGQLLSVNDCVLRSADSVRFLALIDLDEFIYLPGRIQRNG